MPVISVPSWVIPGTYAENLRFLDGKKEIEGVELLFFLYDGDIKTQLDSEWEEILHYRKRFIFTAHLPEPLLPVHEELVSRLAPAVKHFIVHPASENCEAQAGLLAEWKERHTVSFLMENTKPGLLEAVLPHLETGTNLCMDTGHLLLDGKNPADFFARYRERIGEIHLHGLDRGQALLDNRLPEPQPSPKGEGSPLDHRRLRRDDPWLLELLPLLKNYRGIINLEVFSWEEAAASAEILKNLCSSSAPLREVF